MANVFIGGTLLLFASFQWLKGGFSLQYPLWLLASLLITVGIFHLMLAKPTWETTGGKIQMIASGITAVCTQNMLGVLGVACALEMMISFKQRRAQVPAL
jgi:presenilin-like A22 family membrane protease